MKQPRFPQRARSAHSLAPQFGSHTKRRISHNNFAEQNTATTNHFLCNTYAMWVLPQMLSTNFIQLKRSLISYKRSTCFYIFFYFPSHIWPLIVPHTFCSYHDDHRGSNCGSPAKFLILCQDLIHQNHYFL